MEALIALISKHPKEIAIYVLAVNIAVFFLYGLDKKAAQFGSRRIPEASSHVLALLGGSPGAYLGQRLYRHKTKKSSFRLVFWAIVALQACLVLYGAYGWFYGHCC